MLWAERSGDYLNSSGASNRYWSTQLARVPSLSASPLSSTNTTVHTRRGEYSHWRSAHRCSYHINHRKAMRQLLSSFSAAMQSRHVHQPSTNELITQQNKAQSSVPRDNGKKQINRGLIYCITRPIIALGPIGCDWTATLSYYQPILR